MLAWSQHVVTGFGGSLTMKGKTSSQSHQNNSFYYLPAQNLGHSRPVTQKLHFFTAGNFHTRWFSSVPWSSWEEVDLDLFSRLVLMILHLCEMGEFMVYFHPGPKFLLDVMDRKTLLATFFTQCYFESNSSLIYLIRCLQYLIFCFFLCCIIFVIVISKLWWCFRAMLIFFLFLRWLWLSSLLSLLLLL